VEIIMDFRELVFSELKKRKITVHGLSRRAKVDPGNLHRIMHGDRISSNITLGVAKKLLVDGLGMSMSEIDKIDL